MATQTKISVEADDARKGMSIQEFLEFAHTVEDAIKRGRAQHDDLLLGSIGFSAQIKRLSITPKKNDKGAWNIA